MNLTVIDQICQYISQSLDKTNIFDSFIEKCKWYYEKPAHSINEIKMKQNTKIKGDVFEHFAYLYFTRVKGWVVWFLKDVPLEIKNYLAVKQQDLGIDLVAYNPRNKKYYAIQAKYRKFNNRSKTVLGWKQLSTFLVLASRTGPWERHIVFTNAHYIRHAGRKSPKDWSMCLGTMRAIKRHEWESMLGYTGYKLSYNSVTPKNTIDNITEPPKVKLVIVDKPIPKPMDIEDLRKKRLERFG